MSSVVTAGESEFRLLLVVSLPEHASGCSVSRSQCKALIRGGYDRAYGWDEDAAHMTIFSHPTRIAEAVDELWGGALRYEEEF